MTTDLRQFTLYELDKGVRKQIGSYNTWDEASAAIPIHPRYTTYEIVDAGDGQTTGTNRIPPDPETKVENLSAEDVAKHIKYWWGSPHFNLQKTLEAWKPEVKPAATRLTGIEEALTAHFLFSIECNHETSRDKVACGCGWTSEYEPSVGHAVRAWAKHAMSKMDV